KLHGPDQRSEVPIVFLADAGIVGHDLPPERARLVRDHRAFARELDMGLGQIKGIRHGRIVMEESLDRKRLRKPGVESAPAPLPGTAGPPVRPEWRKRSE